jgi:rhodanese-related sulfurtransferase
MLIDRGFELVRPLAGGFEAWLEAGYPVETYD